MENQNRTEKPTLSPRWTAEILRACTTKELVVICAAYGPAAVAERLGFKDIAEFAKERMVLLAAKE